MPSHRLRTRHSRRAERTVLALGLASSLAMLLAALQIGWRPEWTGELALNEAARRISAGVAEEWRLLRVEPERWLVIGDDPIRWRAGLDARAEPAGAEDPDDSSEDDARDRSYPAFDALLAQALHREVTSHDLAGALQASLAALEQDCDAPRRARARLRALQLARRMGADEQARAQWRLARSEMTGAEAEDGVSCLLLAALSAAPLVSSAERVEIQRRLLSLWEAGALALPEGGRPKPAEAGRIEVEIPLEIEVLLDELRALADEPVDAELTRLVAFERGRAVRNWLGELPVAPTDGSLGLRFVNDDVLAFRARTGASKPWFEGTLVTVEWLADALARRLSSLPFFPTGFHVDLAGQGAELGTAVGRFTPLFGDELGYTLRHEDPEAFMRGEERRLGLLQLGLGAMAAVTLVAGFVSFRALRKERALRELQGRFVASVSHELRTPVAGILLATESLTSGRARSPERLERYHGLIQQEADRLRRLVDDMLDFSRLERGTGTPLRLETVALAGYFDELVAESRRRVEEAGLVFDASVQRGSDAALLDREALRRALFNLIDNAVRHAGARRVALSLSAHDELVVHVDDDGRGIPAAQRSTVFEPFRQVTDEDGSRPAAARGTGLGLAIVDEIVGGHGGSARCLPGPAGTGTRFELTLPIRSTADAPPTPPAPSNGSPRT